jgi:hypothetical protein
MASIKTTKKKNACAADAKTTTISGGIEQFFIKKRPLAKDGAESSSSKRELFPVAKKG